MVDIDFHGAKPGDVCNRDGDIRGIDQTHGYQIITAGKVWVTPTQAELAKCFGWEEKGQDGDLVIVARA